MDEHFNDLFNRGVRSRTRPSARRSMRSCRITSNENAFFIPMWEQVITYGVRDNLQGFTPDSGIQPEIRYMSFA